MSRRGDRRRPTAGPIRRGWRLWRCEGLVVDRGLGHRRWHDIGMRRLPIAGAALLHHALLEVSGADFRPTRPVVTARTIPPAGLGRDGFIAPR